MNESEIQKNIRLCTTFTDGILFRNNSGTAREVRDNGRVRHVRYGLGNDSTALNKKLKSSDLIGITPVIIEPHHVGRVFAVFTAVEVKPERWNFRGDERENAQLKFINLVRERGGIATFAVSGADYLNIITEFKK